MNWYRKAIKVESFRNPLDSISNNLSKKMFNIILEAYQRLQFSVRGESPWESVLIPFTIPQSEEVYNAKLDFRKAPEKGIYVTGKAVRVVDKPGHNYCFNIKANLGYSFGEKRFSELHYKLRNAVRHEIEHFAKQALSIDEANEKYRKTLEDSSFRNRAKKGVYSFTYAFIENQKEIEAYLEGWMRVSKELKVPILEVIPNRVKKYAKTMLEPFLDATEVTRLTNMAIEKISQIASEKWPDSTTASGALRNWYRKAQGFADILEDSTNEDFMEDVFNEVFQDDIREMSALKRLRLQREKKTFSVGKRVRKTMGIKGEGTVVPPFRWEESNDGSYKPPDKGDVPVKWDDGTKGYSHKCHIEVIL